MRRCDSRQRIFQLAVFGKQALSRSLSAALLARSRGPFNERVDAAEHRFSLADLILERSLAAARARDDPRGLLRARSAVDLADEASASPSTLDTESRWAVSRCTNCPYCATSTRTLSARACSRG
jgi:hypothetical protein